MSEYRVLAYIYLEAENQVEARYKFEAELPDAWSAVLQRIENNSSQGECKSCGIHIPEGASFCDDCYH